MDFRNVSNSIYKKSANIIVDIILALILRWELISIVCKLLTNPANRFSKGFRQEYSFSLQAIFHNGFLSFSLHLNEVAKSKESLCMFFCYTCATFFKIWPCMVFLLPNFFLSIPLPPRLGAFWAGGED